ncbi:uncharacterized protein LOC132637376 [Lycium barbarum]|uniref:uncharacterized protein LOC132637376 n=1 Tax=Lycium barbarum TaxID=112863 RepID=UPI00293F16A4|nr:uncharacterized protein LOC132637376 [Lycium barbarum]
MGNGGQMLQEQVLKFKDTSIYFYQQNQMSSTSCKSIPDMSDSHSVNFQVEASYHEHNDGGVPNNNVPPVNPIQAWSSVGNVPAGGDNGAMLQQLQNQLDMAMAQLQAQQEIIAQLQNRNQAPDVAPSEQTGETEERHATRNNENHLGKNGELVRMLEELTKRVESGEKKIEMNDKKVENCNSRVDQIPGAPPVLKGPDSKKFIQMPFPPRAALVKIPKRFRMPDIPKYNGTTDPNEHVTAYTCAIKGNDLADDKRESVLLKKFGETLSKGAMIWYHNLPEHSIDSFAMPTDAFVKAHAGAIKVETRKSNLFIVKQYQSKIRVEDDKILRAASVSWHSGKGNDQSKRTTDRDSKPSYDKYQPYPPDRRGNGHNNEPSKNGRRSDRRNDRGPSSRGLINRIVVNRTSENREIPRLSKYNFCVDVATIAAAVIRNRETRHPRPIQSDPEKRDKSLICKYHYTYDHRTKDCRQLREEVARLFNLGHLREFLSERAKTHFKNVESNKQDRPEEPQQVIHMIMGGTDIPIGPVVKRTKIFITRKKHIQNDDPDGPISFSDEDMEGIVQPHNDALVISVLVNKFRIKRVLIDLGSSANIIQWKVIEQLGLLDQIVPAIRVLNGFNMACETTKGEITYPINTAGTTRQTKFYVIEGDMGYNALLGRPWIHLMKAVPSTMHQALKFPTPEGIKTIYGERRAAKEMFAVEESVKTTKIPNLNEGKSAK